MTAAVDVRPGRAVALLIVALTLARIAALLLAPLPLAPDEAQYLDWSRHPAAGYFSKPPLIAWIIALAEATCPVGAGAGGALLNEGCVRWWQPAGFAIAAAATWRCGRVLEQPRLGAVAAAVLVTMPAAVFYTVFATTDAWLVACWALALLAFTVALRVPDVAGPDGGGPAARATGAWLACGACVGLGLLTKYSMGLFVVAAGIELVLRRRLWRRGPWLAAAAAALVFAPNVLWNAGAGFPTLAHTVEISQIDSATRRSVLQHVSAVAGFVLTQWGVFGPWVMSVAVLAAARTVRPRPGAQPGARPVPGAQPVPGTRPASGTPSTPGVSPGVVPHGRRLVLVFAATPLLAIVLQSAISRAFANWAMPAAIGVALLAGWHVTRDRPATGRGPGRGVTYAIALGVSLQLVLAVAPAVWSASPWARQRDRNPFLRLGGWPELARDVAARAQTLRAQGRAPLVVARERDLLASLAAYGWPSVDTVWAWTPQHGRANHYEWFQDLRGAPQAHGRPVLLVAVVPRPEAAPDAAADATAGAAGDGTVDAAASAALDATLGAQWRASLVAPRVIEPPAWRALWPWGRAQLRFVLVQADGFVGHAGDAR